ncbi:MAG: hypothetical protein LBU51_06015 [Bacteroidales bacterium]|nr:hypothetical protein [Bacteroidales bacterium]
MRNLTINKERIKGRIPDGMQVIDCIFSTTERLISNGMKNNELKIKTINNYGTK